MTFFSPCFTNSNSLVFLFSLSVIFTLAFISFLVLGLDLVCSYFLASSGEKLGDGSKIFPVFLMQAFTTINFPLNTAFPTSYKFWCVVALFSFIST